MPDNENTNATEQVTLTPESIAEIVDKRVNSAINNFVHSSKTDLAKIKEQVNGFGSTLESLKTVPTPAPAEQATDPKISVLERQLKELQEQNQTALAKAAKADRDSALGKVLGQFSFVNDTARDLAYKVFSAEMQTIGEGQYAIGDQPLADAVATRMKDLTGLIVPKAVSGSGATPGNNAMTTAPMFKENMSRDDYQKIANDVLKNL